MQTVLIAIIWTIITLLVIFYIYLKILESTLQKEENTIKNLFLKRTALIPSIFEITKKHLNKHDEIFNEILKLRKKEFSEMWLELPLYAILETKKEIHHEINFIFRISNTQMKLIREWKFIYLRELIIKESLHIWDAIEKYKISIAQINKLIDFKNYTLIWYFLPMRKKTQI
jgi:hypothetical protein